MQICHNQRGNTNSLLHGTTNHGLQSRDPNRRREPISYYHRNGPFGELIQALSDRGSFREIGVIGLGTGTIAAYGEPGQRITYYEIDPTIVRIARNPRYFTFLQDQKAELKIVLGDARLSLRDGLRFTSCSSW